MPEVVIKGMGATSAAGRGVPALWSAVRANQDGLTPVTRFAGPRFQSSLAGAVPAAAWQKLLAETAGATTPEENPAWLLAWDALAEARQGTPELAAVPPERIGLILSTTKANIPALELLADGRTCSAIARRHLQADLLAEDLAQAAGCQGPVQAVSVACVSGLVALGQAWKWIQQGRVDAVMVVGVDVLSEFVMAGFTALKALDPLGCRPFDAARGGLSPGEAGAALVLLRQELASAAAVRVRAFGGSNDANHLTGPSRDGSGLALAIQTALKVAACSPAEIDLVHAHGTGTPYNDAMESLALRTVFGESGPPVAASKGLLGHTLGAAGVIESIIGILALQNQCLPGTPRLVTPAQGAPAGLQLTPQGGRRLRSILKLNTGFGGMNGALLLSHE